MKTARKLCGEKSEGQSNRMIDQCKTSNVEANLQTAQDGIVGAISCFLKNKTAVDMVLLSPSITKNRSMSAENYRDL